MPWDNSREGRQRSSRTYGDPEYLRNRAIALARARNRCEIRLEGICTHRATQVDHIVPVSQGGSHDLANLRAACAPCHRHKTAQEGGGYRQAGSVADPEHRPRTAW